ncbi:11L [Ectocarpus siliculosus]|uniref:11L n=1 Tax=Ectocarpus siliculosus TaxID=2880 RepID=D7G492_ECTSI|nr:11L [Ectocarpus siliculosus]|eukprot:CBJ27107.1 11L [Ectocarpus siliculosus]
MSQSVMVKSVPSSRPGSTSKLGQTKALHRSTAVAPKVEAMRLLVNYGADVNTRDNNGNIPLHTLVYSP